MSSSELKEDVDPPPIGAISKRPKRKGKKASSSSSSSSSSSDSSSSSSSSSSEGDSSSDSDSNSDISPPTKTSKQGRGFVSENASSDSSSDSSGSSNPRSPKKIIVYPKPNQKVNNSPVLIRPSRPNPENFVQPGHGKPSTRKRNIRRRLKRLAEAENAQRKDAQVTPFMVESLEDLTNEAPPTTIAQDPVTSLFKSSLTNGNKRRGFKQSMQDVVPQKTIFLPQGETSQTPKTPTLVEKPYTLIPPSQRTDLPRNIIVTSVDVEEGLWGEGVRNETNKPTKPKGKTRKSVDDVLDVVLDYSEDGGRTERTFDWAKADEGFDRYRAAVRQDIVEGRILLWKELALNPTTFCPELMVMAGRVGLIGLGEDGPVHLTLIERPDLEDLLNKHKNGCEGEVGIEESETIMKPIQEVLDQCRVFT